MTHITSSAGNLPSSICSLRELLAPELYVQLCDEYAWLTIRNCEEIQPLKRTTGASFRPRHSRIVSIAINDGGLTDFEGIRLALWAGARTNSLGTAKSDAALTAELDILCSGVPSVNASLTRVRTVFCAVLLDDLRHLHMRDVLVSENREFLIDADNSISNLVKDGIAESLLKKLQHCLVLQKNRVE